MKKISLGILVLSLAVALFSCNLGGYKKLKGGMEYKIVPSGKGAKMGYGDVMKYYLTRMYKDSVLQDSRSQPPMYQPIDSMQLDKTYLQIFREARSGDSIVIRILVDSVFKSNPAMMPPQFRKGEYFFTNVKVISILKPDQAQADFREEVKKFQERDSIRSIAQLAKDDQILKDFITKNSIKAVKTEKGTYVEITNPGGGAAAKEGQVITVNYTGRFLNGKAFDSNVDSNFHHAQPYDVVLGSTPVIKGWEDGLKSFSKGSKGRIFVPSVLAYGAVGSQNGVIKPNENLMFDIEVVDLKDVPEQTNIPAAPKADSAQAKSKTARKK